MKYKRDIVGLKFGKMEVLKYSHTEKKQSFWICICECGKEKTIGRNVFRSTKSCGCDWNYNKKSSAMFNRVLRDYKQRAKKKGFEFKLSESEFNTLISDPCFYCERKNTNTKKFNNEEFFYNGIDRLNNRTGYTSGNVVSCCKICNMAKGELDKDQFLLHIIAVYHSLRDRLII